MVVLLPALGELEKLEAALSEKLLGSVVKEMHETRLPVTFPKFTLRDSMSLAAPLKEMGVVDAFDSAKADFSNLATGVPLFIVAVKHQSFIEVNEEGTE